MMTERGISVDHTMVYRWVQHYAPELKKRLDRYKKRYSSRWQLDETYIKIKGNGNVYTELLMNAAIPLIFNFPTGAMQKPRSDF